MLELKFKDFTESKYIEIGQFKEGLAVVKNHNNLYGYIDKKGKEVIPCQFTKALDFSEGFAAVSNKENLFGFIDVNGKIKIPFQYNNTKIFSEGLVLVQESNYWKFIDKNGNSVFNYIFEEANNFSEGFADVKISGISKNKKYAHLNKNGKIFGCYHWVSPFCNGKATIADNECVFQVNTNYEKINTLTNELYSRIKTIYPTSFGYNLFIDNDDLYGFLDENLEFKNYIMFSSARSFKDDAAIIQLKSLIGFVNNNQKYIMFSQKNQYEEINDFSEGLAAVKNKLGLWGFINKEGKEVIACQYKDVNTFSEGLCGVIDNNERYYYINKNGETEINIPIIYKSILNISDKTICINGKNKKDLYEKKIKVLNQLKKELLKQITSEDDEIKKNVKNIKKL